LLHQSPGLKTPPNRGQPVEDQQLGDNVRDDAHSCW
jgi:hypothetical protein